MLFKGSKRAAFILGLAVAALYAGPSWAEYKITGFSGKVIYTKGYWIQGSTLFFSEDMPSINVYDVESVTPKNLSTEEVAVHNTVINVFSGEVAQFLEREKAIADAQAANVAAISGEAPSWDVKSMTRKGKKAIISDLEKLAHRQDDLKGTWKQTLLPDFSFLMVRDIKLLQLMSLEASIEKTIKYVESGDPTYREYAKTHMVQYISFQESFLQSLPGK